MKTEREREREREREKDGLVIEKRSLVVRSLSVIFVFSSETKKLMILSFWAVRLKNDRQDAANVASRACGVARRCNLNEIFPCSSITVAGSYHPRSCMNFTGMDSLSRRPNTLAGPAEAIYVNREWRLNANAAAGWNMRLHLDELLEKTWDNAY